MRGLLIAGALVSLAALSGCDELFRRGMIKSCTDFYHYSQDPDAGGDQIERVCACAAGRELAGRTPNINIPDAPDHELPAFRRHIPDCFEANGGNPYGIAARESAGRKPRPSIFDPATGRVTEPDNDLPPLPPGAQPDAPPPEEPPPGAYAPPPPVIENDAAPARRSD